LKSTMSLVKRGLTVVVFVLAFTVSSAIAAPTGNEQTFLKLQHDWAEARKNADMHFLDSFYAKEFTVGSMTGGESSRAQDMAMFSSGDLKPAVIEDTEMHVTIYGETAMVTGLEHLEGTYRGNSGKFALRFTNVFVYRDGRWQLVRHQAAQVQNR
jgi:ketosteroid isomerase-like protein